MVDWSFGRPDQIAEELFRSACKLVYLCQAEGSYPGLVYRCLRSASRTSLLLVYASKNTSSYRVRGANRLRLRVGAKRRQTFAHRRDHDLQTNHPDPIFAATRQPARVVSYTYRPSKHARKSRVNTDPNRQKHDPLVHLADRKI